MVHIGISGTGFISRFMDSQAPICRELVDAKFVRRVIAFIAVLALASVLISVTGLWLGRSIVLGGHTEDRTLHEIVIGNNVLSVPSNAIRFEEARVDGVSERLDLYLSWPDMEGYTNATRNTFNNGAGEKRILFLSFEDATMSRDMTGRLDPIYRRLTEPAGRSLGGGLTAHAFTATSGYRDEELIVGEGASPFVARCLTGTAADDSLAPCERDLRIGDDLSLTYRLPRALLAEADTLDAAVKKRAQSFLRTPN